MSTIIPKNSFNPNATLAPGVVILESINSLLISGVPANIVGIVGISDWGPIDSPVLVSGPADYSSKFGSVLIEKYDMGSFIAAASKQGTSCAYQCVRVTDGTEVNASTDLEDTQSVPAVGAILTAVYSGERGNTLRAQITAGTQPSTYRLNIGLPGSISETFDNIGGSGATFWANVVDAVNNGQTSARGASQLAVASLGTGIGNVAVTSGGSGFSNASISASGGGGSGFAGTPVIGYGVASGSVVSGGSGYAAATAVISGDGTGATATVTVAAGAVTAINIISAGSLYTTATIAISGDGTGATATLTLSSTGSIKSVTVTNRGENYATAPTLTISGNGTGAAATATVGSTTAPATQTPVTAYTFSGGTNGNSGVGGTQLLGTDSSASPTGMYALVNTGINLFALVDCDDTTTYTDQIAFAEQNGAQTLLVGPASQTISAAVTAKNAAGIETTSAVFLVGDWCWFKDTANSGVVRMISPQGFYGGLLANLSPEESPLNKIILGVIDTQKTKNNQTYSKEDLILASQNGLELIAKPAPRGAVFAPATGRCASILPDSNFVNIQRMLNFIAMSLGYSGIIGSYIGNLQTPAVRASARNAIDTFLLNLIASGQIESRTVVLDDTNNTPASVALGFMKAQVTVTLFSVIVNFIIDLEVGTVVQQ